MRGWLFGLGVGLTIAGCGAPRAGRARAERDEEASPIVRAMPTSEGYEALARTRIRLGDHELATVRTRILLAVTAQSRRGVELLARVHALDEEDAAPILLDVELDARGGLVHEPLARCDDESELAVRAVRWVLGVLPPWDGTDPAEIPLSFADAEAEVTLETVARRDAVLARASGSADLGHFAVAGWRVRSDGAAHVRIRERLDDDDALVARVEIVTELVATVTDRSGRSRSGVLEIEDDVVVRPAMLERPDDRCD